MVFKLFDVDHKQLDLFLAGVLDASKAARISRERAVDLFCHVVTAAMDHETEFKAAVWQLPDRHLEE